MNIIRSHTVGLLILAGGQGTRLQAVLNGQPKALVRLPGGRSLLLDLVARAERQGLEVCVAVDPPSYPAISACLSTRGHRATCSVDPGRGTATAINLAMERMSSRTILVHNADTIVPANSLEIVGIARTRHPVTQLLTSGSTQNAGLIGVECGKHALRVTHWGENDLRVPPSPLQPASSSGSYIIDRKFWTRQDITSCSLEAEVMPTLVAERAVEALMVNTTLPTFDFGTVEQYRRLHWDRGLWRRLWEASGAHSPAGTAAEAVTIDVA